MYGLQIMHLLNQYTNQQNEPTQEALTDQLVDLAIQVSKDCTANADEYMPKIVSAFFWLPWHYLDNFSQFTKLKDVILTVAQRYQEQASDIDRRNNAAENSQPGGENLRIRQNTAFIAWIALYGLAKDLPLFKELLIARGKLLNELNDLENYSCNNDEPGSPRRERTRRLVISLKDKIYQFSNLVYLNIKRADARSFLQNKERELINSVRSECDQVVELCREHRSDKSKRIIRKILLGIAGFLTLGLALFFKGCYSYSSTHNFTIFQDKTRSHGNIEKLVADIKTLSKKADDIYSQVAPTEQLSP